MYTDTDTDSLFSPLIGFNSSFSYGTGYSAAYGSEGYHHYMRNYDPTYAEFYTDGPSVEDKWRTTYPYVPTSYSYNSIDGKYTVKITSEIRESENSQKTERERERERERE
jgi:hypothetical protein